MMLFKAYIASVATSIVVTWIVASNLSDKLEQDGTEPTEGSAKSASRGAESYLLLFVPVLNLLIAGCFVFCSRTIYERLIEERKGKQ